MRRKTTDKSRCQQLCRSAGNAAVHAAVVTTLVFLLLGILVYDPLSSLSFMAPTEKSVDFRMSDIYNAIAVQGEGRAADERIVVVGLDECQTRSEIANALIEIAVCEPAAVGLDVMFYNPMDAATDGELIDALGMMDNLVLGVTVQGYDGVCGQYTSVVHSFFIRYLPDVHEGFINLMGVDGRSMIRDFTPRVMAAGREVYSFPAQILRIAAPEAFRKLEERGMASEQINFKNHDFLTLTMDDVRSNVDALKGRIVLIGNVADLDDVHNTSVDTAMNGLFIHACTLSTMLNENYIEERSRSFDIVWGVVLCFALAFAGVLLKKWLPGGSDLMLRVLQIVFMWVCLLVGYRMFVRENVYSGFSTTLLALGFTALVLDVWLGLVWLAPKVWRVVKRIANKLLRWVKRAGSKTVRSISAACRGFGLMFKKK